MKRVWGTILALLGIAAFATDTSGKNVLSDAQREQIKSTFGDEFAAKLESSFVEEAASNTLSGELEKTKQQLIAAQQELADAQQANTASQETITTLEGKVATLQGTVNTLSNQAEHDLPPKRVAPGTIAWDAACQDYLGGVKENIMKIDASRPYNMRAYASMAKRLGQMVMFPEASSFDYTSLKADLGDYYRIRKQEALQSFLMKLPSIETIFPLESGYQDEAALVNIFMGEFSQVENTVGSSFNNVVKGTYEFQTEKLKMFDVMFVHKFSDLKQLEKTWIGYLNREGSDVMKWSFIEFILSETGKKLHNERELRRVNGIWKAPIANTPGAAMSAADGYREFIRKKIAAFQIRPFALGEYTDNDISNYIYTFCGMIPQVVRDTNNVVLYVSSDTLTKYWKNREYLYGQNQDYKPNVTYVPEYPNIRLVVVPNLGVSKRIVATLDGNFHTYEDGANEMYNFNIEQEDWNLKVWSNWKESIWANMVGKKYSSLAEIPTDYSTQLIFCNDVDLPSTYFIDMTANDTTPSVLYHKSIQSVANTAATAITAIDDAVTGDVVTIKCNNATNAITIAASGNFSLLTAAWTPDLGDTITLKKRSDGKWIELSRDSSIIGATAFAADDATPDVAGHTVFVTVANTVASPLVPVAITTLDNAVAEVEYTIYGGSDTNSSTIANAGNFVLTAAMTLSNGAWIKLIKSATDGKFYEISRG